MGKKPQKHKPTGETTPKKKKNHTKRNFALEINQAIHEEVEKLLQAEWLANLVLVKKSSGDNPYKRNT
jgi:hypothetical protein